MKQKIRQFLCFLLALQLFSITAYAKPDWPADTGIQAEAGVVMDADSGVLLFGQNIHVAYPPASITKILTALIVLEHCSLDDTVIFTDAAVNSVESDSGNKLAVVAGDQLSVEDCLYGMLLVSANQAANALAIHTAGTMDKFVEMMNRKLEELGCQESHFDNPSGLNGDTQYVTAYDMALIAQAAYENPELLRISADRTHKMGPTSNYPDGQTIQQENRLLTTTDSSSQYYFPAAIAGKTGYLLAAGNTLVTYAQQDGRSLISVILKGSPGQYYLDSKNILEFGFLRFQNAVIADYENRYVSGEEMINLDAGSFRASDLMVEPGRVITLPKGASFADADLSLDYLPADHPERAVARLCYRYNDRAVGEAYLMAKDGVAMPSQEAAPAETAAPEETLPPEETKEANTQPAASSPGSRRTVLVLAVVGALILLAAAAVSWILIQRRKEAADLAARRQRRRERLKAEGQEEEFDRLMAKKKLPAPSGSDASGTSASPEASDPSSDMALTIEDDPEDDDEV